MRRLFRQFSFPGGIPSHVAPETPGLDPRGRRAGLRARPRLRRGVRQPGPARLLRRRRRRGGDRSARRELAFEQVPRPRPRRRRAADPAPQRLQDRQPDRPRPHPRRTSCALLRGLRSPAASRRGRRPRGRAPPDGRRPGRGRGPDPAGPARRAHERSRAAARVADDRPAHARRAGPDRQRWTGVPVEGTFRSHQVPLAAARRATRTTSRSSRRGCAPTGPRSCSTTTGAPVPELLALPPPGSAADERQPARQRRAPAAAPGAARLPRARRRGHRAGARPGPRPRGCSGGFLRDVLRIDANPEQLPPVRARTRSPPTG